MGQRMVFAGLHERVSLRHHASRLYAFRPEIDRRASSFPKENPASRYRKISHKSFCSYKAVTMDAMQEMPWN
jgi:hypothetical protein